MKKLLRTDHEKRCLFFVAHSLNKEDAGGRHLNEKYNKLFHSLCPQISGVFCSPDCTYYYDNIADIEKESVDKRIEDLMLGEFLDA